MSPGFILKFGLQIVHSATYLSHRECVGLCIYAETMGVLLQGGDRYNIIAVYTLQDVWN